MMEGDEWFWEIFRDWADDLELKGGQDEKV